MRVILILLAWIVASVNSLAIVSQRARLSTLSGVGDFQVALFEVNFDQDIVALLPGVGATSLPSLYGSSIIGQNAMPNIEKAAGLAQMNCTKFPLRIHSTSVMDDSNGAPTELLVALPCKNPGYALLQSFGGYTVVPDPSTLYKNQTVFALILGGSDSSGNVVQQPYGLNASNFNDYGCRIVFPDTLSSIAIAEADDHSAIFAGSTQPFVIGPSTFTVDGMNDVVNAVQQVGILSENITSSDQAQAISFLVGAVTMIESWQGGLDAIQQMYIPSTLIVSGQSGTNCVFAPGTALWEASPCCNPQVQYTQCCASVPVNLTVNTFSATTINTDTCAGPGGSAGNILTPVIAQFLEAFALFNAAGSALNVQTLWTSLQAFQQQCQTALYNNPTCAKDSDCIYTQSCNVQSGTCNFNFAHPEGALAACYIATMPANILQQLALDWDLNLQSPTLTADLAAQLVVRASDTECVGQTSQPCMSQTIDGYDSNGNPITIFQPANATCCAMDHQCNWANQFDMTQTECVGTSVLAQNGVSFCGINNGNSQLQDITQLPQCFATGAMTQAACTSLGSHYLWIAQQFGGMGGNCYFLIGQVNTTNCIGVDPICAITKAYMDQAILTHSYNPRIPIPVNNQECGSDLCYLPAYTQLQCSTLRSTFIPNTIPQWQQQLLNSVFWNANLGLCTAFLYNGNTLPGSLINNITTCLPIANWTGSTVAFHQGRQFYPGQWANPTDCAVGQCSIPNLNYFGVNQSQCEAQTQCTQSCADCKTYQEDMNGNPLTLCLGTTYPNQTTCSGAGGQWNNFNGASFCSFAYTQTVCLSGLLPSASFYQCSDLAANSTTCNTTAAGWQYQFIGCQWNPFDQCQTAVQCVSQGQCNDWEFNGCPGQPPGSCPSGGCVLPFQITSSGNVGWCQQPLQQTRIGCMDSTITTPTACAAKGAGWNWQMKASTAAQCAAHGSQCFSADWTQSIGSNRTLSQCSLCHGQLESVYTFTTGEVVQGTQQTTTWQARAWTQTNQMIVTINQYLLSNLFSTSIAKVITREQVNYINAVYGPLIPAMQAIACACSPSTTDLSSCFTATVTNDAACVAPPNTQVTCVGPHGSVTLSNSSVLSGSGVLIQQQYIPGGVVAAYAAAAAAAVGTSDHAVLHSMMASAMIPNRDATTFASSSSSSSPYSLVKNNKGVIIGQIISNGYVATSENITYPTMIQIKIDPSITVNSAYTIADVAAGVNTSGIYTVGVALGAKVTTSATYLTFNAPAPGVYFAVMRSSLSTSDSSSSSSNLSAGAIAGIVIACVVVVVVVIILIVMLGTRQYRYAEVEQQPLGRSR